MSTHVYENSNPNGFDSDCRRCGGKHRDCIHSDHEQAGATASSLIESAAQAVEEIGEDELERFAAQA